MRIKQWYYLISSFVILSSMLLIYTAYIYKSDKISDELNGQLHLNEVYIKEASANYAQLAKNVNLFIFQNKEIINILKQVQFADKQKKDDLRKQLYDHLIKGYGRLTAIGFRQIHFHLPNNHSFLRMHQPDKFGDDLTEIRYSIKKVNETLQPISGFEEGRIVNGFRYVFPLLDEKGRHIGSAEASISSDAFTKHIEKTYRSDLHFIIRKEVVNEKLWKEFLHEYYTESLENDQFYTERKSLKNHFKTHTQNMDLSDKRNIIKQKIKQGKKFVMYHGNKTIISFLPVRNIEENRVIAYFVIYDNNTEISEANKVFSITLIITPLFGVILLYLLRNEYRSRLRMQMMNQELSWRIAQEVEQSQRRDRQMMEQSRLAQMGEMISMIAHQWRQPLGAIASTAIDMQMKLGLQTYDLSKPKEREACHNDFDQSLHDIGTFVENLTRTIDDFQNFYKQNKELDYTSLCVPIKKSLRIIQGSLNANGIRIDLQCLCEERKIHIHTSELMQVFLNILKNAQDNFLEKRLPSPHISIVCKDEGEEITIEVCDNGGGIPEKIGEKIFNPYFSTKDEKNGTGLGLYMSKMIVEEHHQGTLSFMNRNGGACFIITLPGEKA